MRSSLALVLIATAGLTACGGAPTADRSVTADRHDVPADGIDPAPTKAFIAHVHAIATAGTGTLTATELVAILPLDDAGRRDVAAARPQPMDVRCTSAGRCTMHGTGRTVEATLHAQVGPISNPLLGLNATVQAEFVMRGDNGVEFCNMQGLYVRKLFIQKDTQGLLLKTDGDAISLNVNFAGSDNYTCN